MAVSRSSKTNNDKPGVVLPGVVVLVGLDMGSPVLGLWGAPPSGLSGFVGELGEVSFTGGFSTPGALFGGKIYANHMWLTLCAMRFDVDSPGADHVAGEHV